MCLHTKILPNPKYQPNRKNGGFVPEAPNLHVLVIPAACGKCSECRKQKANEWRVRLNEELRKNPTNKFATLTFSDEALEKFEEIEANEVASKAVELFRKRWYKKYKEGIKHWLIVELGHKAKHPWERSTERVHLHGILWTNKTKEEIEKTWSYGWVDLGEYVNEKSINYIVKYVTKIDPTHPGFMGKIFTSKGIGAGYEKRIDAKRNEFKEDKTDERYKTPSGLIMAMPIYYRNKLYTEEEREKLWCYKIDKEIIYKGKIAYDISTRKGRRSLWKAEEYMRKMDERDGYPKQPWKKEIYAKKGGKLALNKKTDYIYDES